jgi:hypothetical protein
MRDWSAGGRISGNGSTNLTSPRVASRPGGPARESADPVGGAIRSAPFSGILWRPLIGTGIMNTGTSAAPPLADR